MVERSAGVVLWVTESEWPRLEIMVRVGLALVSTVGVAAASAWLLWAALG